MSPVMLGNQPSEQPLPTGVTAQQPGIVEGGAAWPPSLNYLYADVGVPFVVGPVALPTRFWWVVSATIMSYCSGAVWQRYDYMLRLVGLDGVPKNDLNGHVSVQKADSTEQAWRSVSISNYFYCEANIAYRAQLLSASSSPNQIYHKHRAYVRIWSHTIGEGVY